MLRIQLEEKGEKGRFVLYKGDAFAGEMTFERISELVLAVDHTEVKPAFAGKGYGGLLLQKVVALARKQDLKIRPVCPFVKTKLSRGVAYRDLLE